MTKNNKRVAAGKKSRRKGSSNENKLAKQFQKWWGYEWARTPSSGGWATKQHREGFRTCGDLICSDFSQPFCVEAKKQEGWTLDQLLLNEGCIIWKWWDQCLEETPGEMVPLLIFSRNRQKDMVMSFFDIIGLSPLSVVLTTLEKNNANWFTVRSKNRSILVIFPLEELFKVDPNRVREAYETTRKV